MSKYSYRTFGYIPSYSLKTNLCCFLFGVPNIFKRLQGKKILSSLDIHDKEKILDFGCGSGYLTVELYRAGAEAFGLDVNKMPTHTALRECYNIPITIVNSGENSPYEDNYFDKILASEILPMISDPKNFLIELKRLLKPSGFLSIVNGFGHPAIEKFYQKKGLFFRILNKLYKKEFPPTYLEYTKLINKSFGTSQHNFLSLQTIINMLNELGFEIREVASSMKEPVSATLSFVQFFWHLKNGKAILPSWMFYFLYPILKVINFLSKEDCSNHLIITAIKK